MIFNAEVARALAGGGPHARTTASPFQNRALTKRELDAFIAELVDRHGAFAVATVLDTIKDLAFRYATQAGITVSKNDIVIPPDEGGDPRRLRGAGRRRSSGSTSAA